MGTLNLSHLDPAITPKMAEAWTTALPLQSDDLLSEMRLSWDKGDPWGSCMAWLFAVASELYVRAPDVIPDAWQYSPGATLDPRDPDAYEYEACAVASTDALLYVGNVLSLIAGRCKEQGLDY